MVDGGQIDTRLARVEQRVSDLDVRVSANSTLSGSVIQLTERFETLRRDLQTYSKQVSKLDEEIARREESRENEKREERRERRNAKFALWGLTATIASALILAAVTLLTAVPH